MHPVLTLLRSTRGMHKNRKAARASTSRKRRAYPTNACFRAPAVACFVLAQEPTSHRPNRMHAAHQNSPAPPLPLERYRLFDSHDLDEAREFVGRVFCPHDLATLRPGAQLDACHHSVPLHRDASLNYVQYGPAVRIEPGHLGGFYLLQIPLRAAVETNAILLGHPLLAEQAENHLLTSLLLSTGHNYSAALASGAFSSGAVPTVLPRVVKRAQEYMHSQLEQPITLADVCAHVGVSARSLQQTFAQCTGKSPMAFLRDLRLDAARTALQSKFAERAPQVSDIAARYGFFHLGHFAEGYRRRFGETPSETRQRLGPPH